MLAWPLAAQEIVTTPIEEIPLDELIGQLTTTPTEEEEEFLTTSTEAVMQDVATASGGDLRILDKLTGQVSDVSLETGQTATLGFLSVKLNECRYPIENPSGDAFTQIVVRDNEGTLFSGWMLASAPALNAMDHPRYDVWALRCMTS
ncbi:DUF2155 domain-containing protein [Roseobacter sp. CCS2]|uniref:DUF2155 domain-containing protein n=1 Tax=Roseobacter sp. CCS2 TaxID=391593 RepID=UPI0000F403D7|nr:DUF2155 domain-containing protein [Roseobacter sp. CCS2]EBA12870.1 hypothetical protein RCCS2_03274 [Roseobacter sp. CCS2]